MKEFPHGSPLPEDFSKKRSVLKKAAIRLLPVSALVFAACSGGGAGEKNSSSQELENKESSGYSLPFPKGETWFLTGGPHADGFSNGVRYAIDIAPPEGGDCSPFGIRRSIENRAVTASASGEVILVGKENDRNDHFHSVVDIKDKNGLTERYIHLDNTKVKLGDKVKQGEALGSPSCEFPPKGGNSGPHVHIGLMKDGQAIPIDGVQIGGWTIHNDTNNYDGTMTKPGEKTRTRDLGRCPTDEACGGIRNDLPNTSNKAIIAGPKDSIPPISGKVTSKEVSTATPTPKPTEKKNPNAENKISISKKPEELFRALLTNPISSDVLPQGMTSGGISAGEIDATGKALKVVGTVNILIQDSVSIANGNVSYVVFPESSGAKSASEVIGTHFGNGEALIDFPYPAKIYTNAKIGFAGLPTTLIIVSVENVTIVTFLTNASFTDTNANLRQARSILLAQAVIKHLEKVGQ